MTTATGEADSSVVVPGRVGWDSPALPRVGTGGPPPDPGGPWPAHVSCKPRTPQLGHLPALEDGASRSDVPAAAQTHTINLAKPAGRKRTGQKSGTFSTEPSSRPAGAGLDSVISLIDTMCYASRPERVGDLPKITQP